MNNIFKKASNYAMLHNVKNSLMWNLPKRPGQVNPLEIKLNLKDKGRPIPNLPSLKHHSILKSIKEEREEGLEDLIEN